MLQYNYYYGYKALLFQLYNLESAHYTSERFGEGTGPIFIDSISCTGSEAFWWMCLHFTHAHGCSHNDDVGIQCQPGICSAFTKNFSTSSQTSILHIIYFTYM